MSDTPSSQGERWRRPEPGRLGPHRSPGQMLFRGRGAEPARHPAPARRRGPASCLAEVRRGLGALVDLQARTWHAALDILAPRPPASAPLAPAGGGGVAATIIVNRPADVVLDLRTPPADPAGLVVHALHPVVPGPHPIAAVEFLPASRPGEVRLRITVPEAQPPGTYFGAVVARGGTTLLGTLTLRLA